MRKRLKDQLVQKVEALHEADRRKDEFLTVLAHELRNPLAPVRNAIHVMKIRPSDAPLMCRMRELIEQEVRSLTRLVDDLLDVSRFKTGKIRLQRETVNLVLLVEEAIEYTRPLMQIKGHRVRCNLASRSLPIVTDPVRIEQILVNLLTNAAKYSEHAGVIDVTASLDEGLASVSSRDTGTGIASVMLEHIVDLFHQADHASDQSLGGLGIGLTLAHRLASHHDGQFTGHSEGLGKRSEFILRLPLAPTPPKIEAPPRSAVRATTARRHRILIVDDNRAMAEGLSEIVEILGYECQTAFDGSGALDCGLRFRPHFVLLDIGLPGLDGFEVAHGLRTEDGECRPRLIAMSGYGRRQDGQRAREIGIEGYLIKPVDLIALHSILEAHSQAFRQAGSDPDDSHTDAE
jgi:CheY-like chemotaxis protein